MGIKLLLVLVMVSTSSCSTCTEFFGGQWYIHWYNCCDNCEEESPYCDGWTWQGASNVRYCGSCGETSYNGKYLKQFECVDCNVQGNCSELVRKYNYPGLCWMWSMAFRGCCKSAASENSNLQTGYDVMKTSFSFCGDRKCQTGEDSTNCPLDCCPLVNNEVCSGGSDADCLPACCSESTCCLRHTTELIGNRPSLL